MPQLELLPPKDEMYRALVSRDADYEGVFVAGIRTTGIFCRPGCPAKKPLEENVEYFSAPRDALLAGYRPCKRCEPLDPSGRPPDWLRGVLSEVERDPTRRWTDTDLREVGVDPGRVRRWFRKHHGMTLHGYLRARRLGEALGRLRRGDDLTQAAYEHGYESLSGFRDAFQQLFGETPGRARDAGTIVVTRILTPLGPMVAGANEDGICLLEFADRRMLERQIETVRRRFKSAVIPGDHSYLACLEEELGEYFAGVRTEFTVPLTAPGTDFQQACWEYLRSVPYGETRSYADQARALGKRAAVRAAGRANGDNRLAVIIPCHRVVRTDGELAGYGGGVWRKRLLLGFERLNREAITKGGTPVPIAEVGTKA